MCIRDSVFTPIFRYSLFLARNNSLILLDALGVTSIARGRLRVVVSFPTVSPAPPSRVPVSPSARVATAVTIDRARDDDDDVDDIVSDDDIVTVLDVARAIARAVSTTARRIMI